MGRTRKAPPTLDDGIIEMRDDKPQSSIHKKRDTVSKRASNAQKMFKVNAALGLPIDDLLEKNDKGKTEYADYEENIITTSTDKEEKDEGSNDTITKKMKGYKGRSIVGDSKILDGLSLTKSQRKFVINLCNPESYTYNDKFMSFTDAGYSAKNRNTLVANVSKLLGNPKIKMAIDRYRQEMVNSKKLEISAETVDILRKRANYDVAYFYNVDHSPKPYDEIPAEWRCCIDDVIVDYKGARADQKILKYKLCDRQKAIDALNKILEITQALGGQGAGRPHNMNISAAIDAGRDKDGNQGPRIVFNISSFDKE